MNARGRILAALDGNTPDRVPCALGFYPLDLRELAPGDRHRDDLVDVHFVQFPLSPEEADLRTRVSSYVYDTRLGTTSQVLTYARWDYRPESPQKRNPLAHAQSLDDLQMFPVPNIDTPYRVEQLEQTVSAWHARGFAVGGNLPHLGGELFEAAWRLRGLENFLLDLVERHDWADYLLDQLTSLARRNAEALAHAGVDVLSLDDDVGMPGSMFISPHTWRRFFKPRLAVIISAARAIKPDLRILYHSDGHIEPIVGDLVEVGVNALNPLQPEHMDAMKIRREFGSRLALWGTVGCHTAFSFGKPREIRREVKHRIDTLGRSGLILCPAYDIDEPDIPWANIAAFLDAVREFG
jgi:uroporphyrinogen decarboxylase